MFSQNWRHLWWVQSCVCYHWPWFKSSCLEGLVTCPQSLRWQLKAFRTLQRMLFFGIKIIMHMIPGIQVFLFSESSTHWWWFQMTSIRFGFHLFLALKVVCLLFWRKSSNASLNVNVPFCFRWIPLSFCFLGMYRHDSHSTWKTQTSFLSNQNRFKVLLFFSRNCKVRNCKVIPFVQSYWYLCPFYPCGWRKNYGFVDDFWGYFGPMRTPPPMPPWETSQAGSCCENPG